MARTGWGWPGNVTAIVGTIGLALGAGAGTPAAAASRFERVGTVRALPAHARVTGNLQARKTVRLTVVLAPRDPAGLAALAGGVSQPGSRSYGRFLTVAGFARRFGAPSGVVAIVTRALRARGIHVGHLSANGLALPVSGTTAQVEHAFATSIADVRLAGGERAYANRTAPELPVAIAPYVQDVLGLDDLDRAQPLATIDRPAVSRSRAVRPDIVTGGPQPCSTAVATGADTFAGSSGNLAYRAGYTADLLASVYGLSGLYQARDEGAGQTVAVVDEEPYLASDIDTYQNCYQTNAKVSNVPVGSGVGTTLPSDDEAVLDIETVISTAPRAAILVYQGSNQLQVLQQIVSEDRAKVISSSWATCEASTGAQIAHDYSTVTQEAAVQGQSILAASGDNGSQCGTSLGTQPPASDPNVTAVGGTTLYAMGLSGGEPYAEGRTPLEAGASTRFTWTVHKPGAPTAGKAHLTGVGSRRPKLSFFVKAGSDAPAVRSITLVLPSGIGLARTSKSLHKGINVKRPHGRAVSFSVRGERGHLVLGFRPAVAYVTVNAKGPALTASRSLAHKVRAHKLKKLRIMVRVVDAASKTTTIPLTIKV